MHASHAVAESFSHKSFFVKEPWQTYWEWPSMRGCSFLSKVLYRVYRVLGMIRFVRFRVRGYIGFEVIWFRRKKQNAHDT